MSAILEKIKRTWFISKFNEIFAVVSENASTSLQIIFLTKPTGICLIMTYNRHIPEKKMMCHFLKKSPNFLKTILCWLKISGFAWMFQRRVNFIVWLLGGCVRFKVVGPHNRVVGWGDTDILGKSIWGIASWHAGKPPSPNSDIIIQSAVLATVSE